MTEMPYSLIDSLSDAKMELLSWQPKNNLLRLRVTKEIVREVGIIQFTQVGYIEIVPRLTIEGLQVGPESDLPDDFFSRCAPSDTALGSNETVFVIHGSWGEKYFVIAEDIEYETVG